MKVIKNKAEIQYKLVEDINIGVEINKNYNMFHNIKTDTQFKKWKEKTINFKSGTYKMYNLLETIDNFISSTNDLDENKNKFNNNVMNKTYLEALSRILN